MATALALLIGPVTTLLNPAALQAGSLPRAGSCLESRVATRTFEPMPAGPRRGAAAANGSQEMLLLVVSLLNGIALEAPAQGGDSTFYGNFASAHRVSLCVISGAAARMTLTDLVTGASLLASPRGAAARDPAGRPSESPAAAGSKSTLPAEAGAVPGTP